MDSEMEGKLSTPGSDGVKLAWIVTEMLGDHQTDPVEVKSEIVEGIPAQILDHVGIMPAKEGLEMTQSVLERSRKLSECDEITPAKIPGQDQNIRNSESVKENPLGLSTSANDGVGLQEKMPEQESEKTVEPSCQLRNEDGKPKKVTFWNTLRQIAAEERAKNLVKQNLKKTPSVSSELRNEEEGKENKETWVNTLRQIAAAQRAKNLRKKELKRTPSQSSYEKIQNPNFLKDSERLKYNRTSIKLMTSQTKSADPKENSLRRHPIPERKPSTTESLPPQASVTPLDITTKARLIKYFSLKRVPGQTLLSEGKEKNEQNGSDDNQSKPNLWKRFVPSGLLNLFQKSRPTTVSGAGEIPQPVSEKSSRFESFGQSFRTHWNGTKNDKKVTPIPTTHKNDVDVDPSSPA